MTSHVTVILYPLLNYWSEIPESKSVNATEEVDVKKDTMMIKCREITKRLMILDINIITMIECCQEIKAS